MKDCMRVGVVGLGCRGPSLIDCALLPQENVKICAVCDVYEDRVEAMQKKLSEQGQTARGYTDYHAMFADGGLDAVICATAWEAHVPVCCAAMEAGIPVGCEVGGALTLDDCYLLVRTWEKTHTPFMFLENCNYDRKETALFAMIEAGVFGKIVACDGGYMHDLRAEVAGGKRNRHYRLEHYLHRNCENYPTHELGPIARMLHIGRGNRMVSLVSVASSACGMNAYLAEKESDNPACDAAFAQGDVVTTIITCEGGETVTLRLDTTLPRYYSRGLCIHGTKALYTESNNTIYVDGEHNQYDWNPSEIWGNFTEYAKPYRNADWLAKDNGLAVEGHGGMDYFMMRDFLSCVAEGKEMPLDVYDAAVLMCISPLSEQSIRSGGSAVPIPDFTNGAYKTRK